MLTYQVVPQHADLLWLPLHHIKRWQSKADEKATSRRVGHVSDSVETSRKLLFAFVS